MKFIQFLFNGGAFAKATSASTAPTVTTLNGTYSGAYNSIYDVDWFLGIPYVQSPVGPLRYRAPQPVQTSWSCMLQNTVIIVMNTV